MNKTYGSIANAVKVPLLDYWNDTITTDTSYFCNSTHLNKIGSELFTRKFIQDLDSIRKSEQQ